MVRGQVDIQAGRFEIHPAISAKLLGCELSDDLKWKHPVRDSDQSLLKQLTSRVNGLSLISSRADLDTKLMMANGLVRSRLCYLIQLLGGCEGYLLQKRADWSGFTSTRRLLAACG